MSSRPKLKRRPRVTPAQIAKAQASVEGLARGADEKEDLTDSGERSIPQEVIPSAGPQASSDEATATGMATGSTEPTNVETVVAGPDDDEPGTVTTHPRDAASAARQSADIQVERQEPTSVAPPSPQRVTPSGKPTPPTRTGSKARGSMANPYVTVDGVKKVTTSIYFPKQLHRELKAQCALHDEKLNDIVVAGAMKELERLRKRVVRD